LRQGDFSKEIFYSANPVEIAKKWQSLGAKFMHIVDLDGALYGEPKNLPIVEDILKAVDVPLELGGGLRTDESVENVLSKGISRAVVSTRAYIDEDFIKRLIKKFKSKIAVSIDAAGENIVTEGWTSITSIRAIDLAKKMEQAGVSTIIYTNVLKDGTMERPQFEFVKQILNAVKIDIIIAGGISSLDDIRELRLMRKPNLSGVIVGRALYEGRLDLKEAIKLAEGEKS
jgi:phosphoribosylformimino-5-aminoimidazole carboxamide ribotide isomerase